MPTTGKILKNIAIYLQMMIHYVKQEALWNKNIYNN